MSPAAIVLAAGFSSRMGSPKALLQHQGRTFLSIILERLPASPVVVVLGAGAEAIREAVPPGVRVAVNPDPARGMFSSVVVGAAALEGGPAFLCLVDHPLVARATYAALAAVEPAADEARIAACEGATGHPVLLGAGLVAALAAGPSQPTLEVFLASRARRTAVETADPAVLHNVNTPGDLRTLGQE